MSDGRIELRENGVRVLDVDVPGKEVTDLLSPLTESERVPMLVRAIRVGALCLARASAVQDSEFIRRQLDALLNDVRLQVMAIPGAAQIALLEKIGTNDGQVLAPVQTLLNAVKTTTEAKLKEIQDLLQEEIDPTKEKSTLGDALRKIQNIIDPQRKDSIQSRLQDAVDTITKADGDLVTTVKEQVTASISPMLQRVTALEAAVHAQEQVDEALAQTTEKGTPYEEEVVARLQDWARFSGVEVEHVGPDNKPGDVVVRMTGLGGTGTHCTIVIEVKDRQDKVGRVRVSAMLSEAMPDREATAAVYLSRTRSGLAKEIGDWAEGETTLGPWVACIDDYLLIALRHLNALHELTQIRASRPEVDTVAISSQIQRIRTSLNSLTNIKTKANALHNGATEIEQEADALRKEIVDALVRVEESLRSVAAK